MPHHTHKCRAKPGRTLTQHGFSFIELTIAMGLSLLVLGLALQLFDQLYYLSDSAMAIADANQTVRASIKQIGGAVKSAGSGIPTGGIPLPGGTGIPSVNRPGPGAQTFPLSPGAGPPPPVLSAVTPGNGICNGASTLGINGPCDEVTVTMVDLNSQLNQAQITSVSATQITFAAATNLSTTPTQVNVGDLLMLSNNNGAALGYVTKVNTTTNVVEFAAGDPMQLNQPTATSGNIAKLANPDGTYPPTSAYEVRMVTYYLDNTVPGQPRLMRQVGYNNQPQAPLVVASYVTGLQFTYDLSDGTTVNNSNPTFRNQIRKVNVAVTARSSRPLRKTNAFFSNTMATSIMVRNLAYSNKYQ